MKKKLRSLYHPPLGSSVIFTGLDWTRPIRQAKRGQLVLNVSTLGFCTPGLHAAVESGRQGAEPAGLGVGGGRRRRRRPGRGEAGTKSEICSKSAAPKTTGRRGGASARVIPLQPVDHVSHQGIGDAGEGLFCQQDGCPQLVQDQRVPVHLLLSRFELETREREARGASETI